MSESPTVRLLQIKSWYIPADAASYNLLKSVGLPLLKFGTDMVPTLKLVTDPRGIKLIANRFQPYFEQKLDQLGSTWLKKEDQGRKCLITDKRLTFTANLNPRNKKAIVEIDNYLSAFFARWGFAYNSEYSETANKIKLVVDFYFDKNREPVIPLVDSIPLQEAEIVLGFTKIKLTFFRKPTEFTKEQGWNTPITMIDVLTQSGSDWTQIWRSTFNEYQVGELTSMINGLTILNSIQKVKE
jgi:hypothetical protein